MSHFVNHALHPHIYYATGGSSAWFYAPASQSELLEALREISNKQVPAFIIGAGSNSLLMDDPWPGAVLSLHNLKRIEVSGTRLRAEAGASNGELVATALAHGLDGVAWMHRLPGQIGAAVRMNARCYGGEISQVASEIHCLDWQGRAYHYRTNPESRAVFRGYKDTIFMHNQQLITAVEMSLRPGDREAIQRTMQACEQDREAKRQFSYPSCGCVFKNNYSPEVSVPSGLLLELIGAKGLVCGQAQVSPDHGNFIFNRGGARSEDIVRLSLELREQVWQEFGVWLAYEMEIHGTIPADLRIALLEERAPCYNHDRLAQARAQFLAKRTVHPAT